VNLKWFGAPEPLGFTSAWTHWRYAGGTQELPRAARVLAGLCDLRIPLTLTPADCDGIVGVIEQALHASRN
jgi:hypothetical protein